jgi:plasmid stabilization system protein ParE
VNYRYHRLVQRDVNDAVAYYEEHASDAVADGFFEELLAAIEEAAENPTRHHFLAGSKKLRRANLKRFPFHFLYEIRSGTIYIVVVRHHRRHPRFGMRRKRSG